MNPYGLSSLVLAICATGCGARTGLPDLASERDGGVEDAVLGPACSSDSPCPGADDLCRPVRCVLPEGICESLPEVLCDDLDPCTADRCLSESGQCVFDPLTFDLDGDGFKGPRPGFAAGAPGSCGDDCDDTSEFAYPGGEEICDGVDNDCNGIVDDGASFVPGDTIAVLVSQDKAPAGPTGLGWSGNVDAGYLAAYSGSEGGKTRVYLQRLSFDGQLIDPAEQLTLVNADADGGIMVWTGDRYGIAWYDRRFEDYEIFFNLTDAYGTKLIPDVRISNDWGFSVYPSVVFDGTHFVVAWQDDRQSTFGIYGQRIALDGTLVGLNVPLAWEYGKPNEAPFLAKGEHNLGMVWQAGGVIQRQIVFQTFDHDLQVEGPRVPLTSVDEGGVYPMVVWNRDAYVAAWFEHTVVPYTVYGAVIDKDGTVLTPATPLAVTPSNTRYPWLMPLGDRLLLVFSDDRDGNEGYELYGKMLTANLEAASEDLRITDAIGHSISPMASFGPTGDVGVLFRDDRLLEPHVFFTRLSCVIPD